MKGDLSEDEKKVMKIVLGILALIILSWMNMLKYAGAVELWFIVYIGVSLMFVLFMALVFRNDIREEKTVLPPSHPSNGGVVGERVKGRYE